MTSGKAGALNREWARLEAEADRQEEQERAEAEAQDYAVWMDLNDDWHEEMRRDTEGWW